MLDKDFEAVKTFLMEQLQIEKYGKDEIEKEILRLDNIDYGFLDKKITLLEEKIIKCSIVDLFKGKKAKLEKELLETKQTKTDIKTTNDERIEELYIEIERQAYYGYNYDDQKKLTKLQTANSWDDLGISSEEIEEILLMIDYRNKYYQYKNICVGMEPKANDSESVLVGPKRK